MTTRQWALSVIALFAGCANAVELTESHIEHYAISLSLGTAGAGLSVFSLKHRTELALTGMSYGDDGYDSDEQTDIRLHLRHFFNQRMDGWFYGGYLQRSTLNGKLKDRHREAEQAKTSLGLELGYKSFSVLGHKDLYWGVGAGVSGYIAADDQNIFESEDLPGDATTSLFVDVIRLGAVF